MVPAFEFEVNMAGLRKILVILFWATCCHLIENLSNLKLNWIVLGVECAMWDVGGGGGGGGVVSRWANI
jgi:hypothetical protein